VNSCLGIAFRGLGSIRELRRSFGDGHLRQLPGAAFDNFDQALRELLAHGDAVRNGETRITVRLPSGSTAGSEANFAQDSGKIDRRCNAKFDEGFKYKLGRTDSRHKIKHLYFGKVQRSLKSRFNVPVPIMAGFADTL
jgi:hypothetical protein